MLNIIWGGMLVIGITLSLFTGNIQHTTTEILQSSKDTVTLLINIAGIMAIWSGILAIAEQSGLINTLCKSMYPFLHKLFPTVPKESPAINYMAINIIANMLGMAYVATPAGIKVMTELQKYNTKKDTATKDMANFLLLNLSSLQIVSINIIAYRNQYGSKAPEEIISTGLIATLLTTFLAIAIIMLINKFYKE